MTSRRRAVAGLVLACHPLPSAAVTAFAGALALVAGGAVRTTLLVAAAVLSGQLGVGWLNDLHDAPVDGAAARADKPVVRGDVDPRTLRTALAVSVPLCVALSLALGPLPGLLHLAAVASAWTYDLALKGTRWSGVPYLVSFGLLPVIAATAVGGPASAPLAAAAAVVGLGGHLANTLSDVDADAATGVRGLPQRLGPVVSQRLAGGCVVAACALVLLSSAPGAAAATVLAAGAALGLASAVVPRRAAFRVLLLATAVVLAGLVLVA